MSNSRLKLMALADDEKPTNSSRGKGLILETPYRPGFVDDKDLETVKMAVDKELSEISNAFYQTTERTADTITRIDKIEIEGDGLLARIEEVDRVSKEGDVALAERITKFQAETDTAIGKNTALITEETRVRTDADTALAERITKLEVDIGGDIKAQLDEEKRVRASADEALSQRIVTLNAEMTTENSKLQATIKAEETARVTADTALTSQINNAVSKLDGDIAAVKQYATTEISKVDGDLNKVEAKWGVSVDANGAIGGIELNSSTTRGTEFKVRADRFVFSDGGSGKSGGFTSEGGVTKFNGELKAAKGTFAGDISASTGTFTGGINIQGQGGNVGMKITNNQILVYDQSGRLRVKLGLL